MPETETTPVADETPAPLAEEPGPLSFSRFRRIPYRRRKLRNTRFGFASNLKLRAKYERGTYRFGKRVIDLTVALAVLILFSPLLLILAIGVGISAGWPVTFAQRRIGRGGKVFRMFKFRSMVKNAEEILRSRPDLMEEYQRTFKIQNDPRIFPLGRIIRRTSLDELPQLWNVVRGEMSIVGPRPIVERELEMYGDKKHVYLAMTPGCAGLWQCSGRSDLDYEERVLLDEQYYMSASLRNDLKILWMTFVTILRREGSV